MGYRIGIATSDNIVVNQHFGRARSFQIVDVDEEGSVHIVEQRKVNPICDGGNHDNNMLKYNVRLLSDCDFLLVARIGDGAANVVEDQGIQVFEIPGLISESVEKLLAYVEIQKMLN